MYSCDYNGWADVPEEEREGIDAFEAVRPPLSSGPPPGAASERKGPEFKASPRFVMLPYRKAA